MIKRSMYYLSKMYEEQLGNGEDYSIIEKNYMYKYIKF